jgi:hypothetical protein
VQPGPLTVHVLPDGPGGPVSSTETLYVEAGQVAEVFALPNQ